MSSGVFIRLISSWNVHKNSAHHQNIFSSSRGSRYSQELDNLVQGSPPVEDSCSQWIPVEHLQLTMLFSRVLQQWFFAMFLFCSPVPNAGRPVDTLSARMKRSVTHTQLMHDKSRTLQDFRRRMWLQDLLDVVHTAEIFPVRSTGSAGSSGAGQPGAGLGGSTGGTLHSKPVGGTKDFSGSFQVEQEEDIQLPQETFKESMQKLPGKRRKNGKSGKRREKRKRRARSLKSGLQLDWSPSGRLWRALQ